MDLGKTTGIFFALSLSFLTACSDQPGQSSEAHVKNAQLYFESGQLPEALVEIKNALRASPKDPEVRWLAGQIHLESGNNSAAIKELSRALELGLERADADLPLVRAWMAQGQLTKALDYFESKELSGLTDDAKIMFTDLLIRSGDTPQAEEILLKMLESSPGLLAVRLGLARIELGRAEQDKARTQIEQILEVDPENPFANLIAGELEITNINYAKAQSHYNIAAKAPQTRLQAQLGNARIQIAQLAYEEAANALDAILANQPDIPLALFLKGLTHYHLAEFDASQETLERVQVMIPKHGPTLLLLGKIYLDDSRLEQANLALESLLASDPTNAGGRQLLAATKLRLKQPQEALKLINIETLDQINDPLTLIIAGSAYIDTGKLSEGTSLLEKASTLVKDPSKIRSQLARIYLASGDIEQAIAEFRSLTESDNNNPQHLLMLAYAQVRQADFDQATITAEQLNQQGSKLLAANLKGAIEMARNQIALAQQYFESAIAIDNNFIPAHLNLARIAISQERNRDAKLLLSKILDITPSHSEALLLLAKITSQTDGTFAAVEMLKAFTKQHKNAKVLMRLAELTNDGGNAEEAIDYAVQARQLAPSDLRVISALASLQRSQGNIEQAIETLIDIPPKDRDSNFNLLLSQVARAADRPRLARDALSTARKQSPNSLSVIINSISLALFDKNIQQAEELLALITKKHDASGAMRLALKADIFRSSGDHQQAIQAYTSAFKLEKHSNILNNLVGELLAVGEAEKANTLLTQWLGNNPDDLQALLRLSNQHMVSGKHTKAAELYERVLNVNPLQPLALNNLAWMYYQQGNQRALTLANELAALKIERADTLDTVGWIYTNMGNLAEGIAILQQANDLDPTSADVIFHLATAYSRNNQRTQVEGLLSVLTTQHPEYSERDEVSSFIKQFKSSKMD